MTIQELQETVDQWIKDYGVRYFSELSNMTILMEETGELARLMVRLYGDQSFKNQEDSKNAKDNIKDELADIIFVVTCLANQMQIDLDTAIKANLDKKTRRDALRHQKNTKL